MRMKIGRLPAWMNVSSRIEHDHELTAMRLQQLQLMVAVCVVGAAVAVVLVVSCSYLVVDWYHIQIHDHVMICFLEDELHSF